MGKIFNFVVLLMFTYYDLTTAIGINCTFDYFNDYYVFGSTYRCSVNNNVNITSPESATITSVTGTHQLGRNNNDVESFDIRNKTVRYFPKGLEKFFPNLKAILIFGSELREVHQSDLKPFPKLVYLYLGHNAIQVIEEGLFAYNPKLEYIAFSSAQLIHIDPYVFDQLIGLTHFWFHYVPCINQIILGSRTETLAAIALTKVQCVSAEYSSLDKQLKTLTNESKVLDSDSLAGKLINFEQFLKNSNFSSNSFFKSTLEGLKGNTSAKCCSIFKLLDLETKIGNLSTTFEKKCSSDFSKIENELFKMTNKVSAKYDEKINGIEGRLMKSIEKVIQDKLGKILDEKLSIILDAL